MLIITLFSNTSHEIARIGLNSLIGTIQTLLYHKPCQNHHNYENIFGHQARLASAVIISFTDVLFDQSGKFHIVLHGTSSC